VGAVEVEADDLVVAGLVHEAEVVAGRFEVAHGALAGVALEVEGDAEVLAEVQERGEAFGNEFERDIDGVRDGVAAEAAGAWGELEEVAPGMGGGAGET